MATLHFVSGKAGAGKTTLARQIAQSAPAILFCEDEWMSKLAEPIENLQEYLTAARKIRSVIAPLSVDLLKLGTSGRIESASADGFPAVTVRGRLGR